MDLNDLIDPSPGFFIDRTAAINASGQIIANGLNPGGQISGLLLTPEIPAVPLPAGLPLLLTGLAAFGLRRRRRT
jgi:hypothetical protein